MGSIFSLLMGPLCNIYISHMVNIPFVGRMRDMWTVEPIWEYCLALGTSSTYDIAVETVDFNSFCEVL